MEYVFGQVVARGGYIFDAPIAQTNIPCDGMKVLGIEWFTPVIGSNGFQDGYDRQVGGTQPKLDSFKTVRITNSDGRAEWILIDNAADETAVINICNACCGQPNDLPVIVIPDPIIETTPCPVVGVGTTTYTYMEVLPTQNGYRLFATFSANGIPQPALNPAGYATPAALLAAAQATWALVGRTWTLEQGSTILQLVSTVDTSAGLNVTRIPKDYCYDILANDGDVINELVLGGAIVSIPQVTVDATNGAALLLALQPYIPGLTYVEDALDADHPYLQVNTLVTPTDVRDAGVVTGAFTVGLCF